MRVYLKMTKQFGLVLLFFSAFLLGSCEQSEQQKTEERSKPNIVIFLTDDQGWGDLSLTGNVNLTTPNIDGLAADGVIFDRFYVSPVCSPTRAELLTGRHHARSGVYATSMGGERMDLDEATMADAFKQAGYATAVYGKWHNGMQYPYHPNGRGFDDFYGFASGHWGNYFSPMLEHNGEIVKGEGYVIDDFTNHALDFIDANKDAPFLLYMPYNTPHRPMQVPDRWWNSHDGQELTPDHRYFDKQIKDKTRAAYAMMENIDWNVGRVNAKLEELGLTEDTIVLFFSDNGPNGWRWNDNMKGTKGSTDEGGVRSPAILKWKGHIEAGKEITQIASVRDLFPTFMDLAGISFDDHKPFDGKSLKPLIEHDNAAWQDRYVISSWRGKVSVRSQQYRLDGDNQLFDMVGDSTQSVDISIENDDITKLMVAAKREWEENVHSELPDVDTRTFPIGHPDFTYTQIPARDGVGHGNIKRSNKSPNDSYYTNWISVDDKITWDAEVVEDGDFDVTIYYTAAKEAVGSTLALSFGDNVLNHEVTEEYDPPLIGTYQERTVRPNSYVKDWRAYPMGSIHLKKGEGKLTLQAIEVPNGQVIDFRLIMLKRK